MSPTVKEIGAVLIGLAFAPLLARLLYMMICDKMEDEDEQD